MDIIQRKMKYTFKIFKPYEKEELQIFLEKEMGIIEDFLEEDVGRDYDVGEKLKNDLNDLVKGKYEFLDWNGNVCALEAKKDMAEVSHFYKGEGVPDSCWIETSELIELIQIWMDAYKRFELEGSGWVEKRRKV